MIIRFLYFNSFQMAVMNGEQYFSGVLYPTPRHIAASCSSES